MEWYDWLKVIIFFAVIWLIICYCTYSKADLYHELYLAARSRSVYDNTIVSIHSNAKTVTDANNCLAWVKHSKRFVFGVFVKQEWADKEYLR